MKLPSILKPRGRHAYPKHRREAFWRAYNRRRDEYAAYLSAEVARLEAEVARLEAEVEAAGTVLLRVPELPPVPRMATVTAITPARYQELN